MDNDGNGYVDDVRGWDFDGNSNNINSGGANDDHGTHVAGTIAGAGGNGKGVAGVCWSSVKLISGRFLGRRGGDTANAVKALDYFTDLKTRHGLNLVATNNSWGGGGYSQALSDAIDRAGQAEILTIVAAGNDSVNCEGNTSGACYPASYPNASIISVAALRSTGALVYNYGATTVDLGAPGYWHLVDGAEIGEGQGRVRLRQLQRHLDGHAACHRCRGSVCIDPSWRDSGADQGRHPQQHRADAIAAGQDRHWGAPRRQRLLTQDLRGTKKPGIAGFLFCLRSDAATSDKARWRAAR